MTDDILQAVADVINDKCYWARVVTIRDHIHYYNRQDGHINQTTCRCITLQVKHTHLQYCTDQRWQIPEPDLHRVSAEMEKEKPAYSQHLKELKPTDEEVNELVKRATYGVIDLDLVDDDYVPLLFRTRTPRTS